MCTLWVYACEFWPRPEKYKQCHKNQILSNSYRKTCAKVLQNLLYNILSYKNNYFTYKTNKTDDCFLKHFHAFSCNTIFSKIFNILHLLEFFTGISEHNFASKQLFDCLCN